MKKKGILVLCLLISLVFYAQNTESNLIDSDKDGLPDLTDKCPYMFGAVANSGCPGKIVENLGSSKHSEKLCAFARAIYFNSGKYTFMPGVKDSLAIIANIMKEFPDLKFGIEGHTDNCETAKNRQVLSEKRAKRIIRYLVSKGGDKSKFLMVGYSDMYPLTTNETEEGRAQNRRVEIKLRK